MNATHYPTRRNFALRSGKKFVRQITFACMLVLTAWLGAQCGFAAGATSPFATPLRAEQLDESAFGEWVDGTEKKVTLKTGTRHVIWTQNTQPEWNGVTFGDSKVSGPRHLRIGWNAPIEVGSVLVRGGGQLSVLRPTAEFPGRMDRAEDWVAAQRIKGNQVSQDEAEREEYALWVLPPGTSTRALRFTHTSQAIDKSYAGWLGGVFVLRERMANIAPQAVVSTGANTEKAHKVNNENNDGMWSTWDNAPETNGPLISASQPAWVLLTWGQAVKLRGLNALWAGFSATEVEIYTGPSEQHPRESTDTQWQRLQSFDTVQNQYPRALGVNWMDFGRELTTRGVRLRVTRTIDESRAHGHLKGNTKGGRRIWLGDLFALQPLGNGELSSAILPAQNLAQVHPPIPIRFTLPEEGYITLVLDDENGKRVRNLIAETKFPAGANTVWWDGTDDLLRDVEAYRHGVYRIPQQFVTPGKYVVRGLWRKGIDLRYEFSIYNAGQPAWEIADKTGAWLANHTPPCSALYVPGNRAPEGKPLVFLGSYVSEGGHGLAWVDLNGRKQGGVGWVGGNWTGAPFLARDDGPGRDTDAYAYAAAAWSDDQAPKASQAMAGEIRLTALTTNGHKAVLKYKFTPPQASDSRRVEWSDHIGGLAARNGMLVVSLPSLNQLLFVDAKAKQVLGTAELEKPRGLGFDRDGRFYALSATKLLRFTLPRLEAQKTVLPKPESLAELEAPRALTFDDAGNIYVSDRGQSHTVKVFSPSGKLLRTIGQPGIPKAGPYNPLHMNNPDGLTIDSQNHLWVTENDYQPKRVSVWTLDGQLVRAFYGPSEYGGGGKLDPEDKTKFYYHGMEFRLDWDKGTDQLVNVFYRPVPGALNAPDGHSSGGVPEQPHYVRGRKYFSNDHNSNPTGGTGLAMIWQDVNGIARPVAALGRAQELAILKSDTFQPLWPKGVNLRGDYWQNITLFTWSDLNFDGQVQTNEVKMQRNTVGSITVGPGLSMVGSRIGTNAVRFAPSRFTAEGVPVYDLDRGEILATGTQSPVSSGGDQALWHPSGWTILTTPPKPLSPYSVGAVYKGNPRWSYPSPWPGLHASHESPAPDLPGQIVGTTRLLGDVITPPESDAGPIWCVNGNQGNMYLFTVDGLFVGELFKDVRRGPTWSMPIATRGMLLNGLTLHDENFWPTITQTKDGNTYLVDGARTSLVRVDGLNSIRRLPENTISVTAEDLTKARAYFVETENLRQQSQGTPTISVALRKTAPSVDGTIEDWLGADWADIDKSGVAAFFDSKSKPYDVRGAVMVAGDRLYAAFRTGDANLLRNSGEMPTALFKTGGALDIMVGTDAATDAKRAKPVAGDCRLLVSQVKGKTAALLYRAVVPGTTEPVPFSSPWRTITLDRVDDVADQVQFAGTNGNYELSIPLTTLGLKPESGMQIKGDIGILRGNGFQTLQRVYWANKTTGITSDVPSEAELTPRLWGRWQFKSVQ